MRAYLGLGSNLGDRPTAIARAIELLGSRGRVLAVAPLYETEPWGLIEQPRFINSACIVEVELGPLGLLAALKAIERQMGRVAGPRNGPRIIDLDILMCDGLIVDLPCLRVPHVALAQRATALVPLADIAPEVLHPLTRQTVAAHLDALRPISGIAPYPPGLPSAFRSPRCATAP
ncbi:MAG: 2-amino-4-hydroxy-6-hydroxymethyldihydropteridine diphosphokinase [Anaerolineae bacterium]